MAIRNRLAGLVTHPDCVLSLSNDLVDLPRMAKRHG